MNESNKDIWFPAKRYGWGWGLPCAWQGWAVLLAWMAAVTAGIVFLDSPGPSVWGFIFLIEMLAMLIVVCLMKGEKPRWRWGR
jgi:uncharacterized membrane protein YhaH (DUF805 family)